MQYNRRSKSKTCTFITNSKYPTSESKVVGVYGLITSSPWLSLPLLHVKEKLYHTLEINCFTHFKN